MLEVPILFIIFNRPETTRIVFEAIRNIRPKELYICADGPRVSVPSDQQRCEAARSIIDCVDWQCEIKTLFRNSNLGCKYAVSGGVDWFFDNVDAGIVLEDDCLPDESFFRFCEELLLRYRDDERVMQICGSNFLNGWRRSRESYYFSLFGPIWGWASWRRAWAHYDVEMKLWPEVKQKGALADICLNRDEENFRLDLYERLYNGEIDTWDYQWGFAKMINSGYSITPNVNLISNIGFGVGATHTSTVSDNKFAEMKRNAIEFPLLHPGYIVRDTESDLKYFDEFVLQNKNDINHNKIYRAVKLLIAKVINGN